VVYARLGSKMDSAKQLFEKLRSFKSTKSPQQALLEFCTHVLGSIERLHVDFKEKHDRHDANLSDDDRKNLAKAVSGFGNSSGGVLLWSIEDKTLLPKPIVHVDSFVSSMLQIASQITDPILFGIDGDWIESDERKGQSGFGLLLIPESLLPPHRVVLNQLRVKDHYYIRTGNSFVVASHTQLEDMFGRRPKPNLSLNAKIVGAMTAGNERYLRVILGIENKGRGTAKYPFLAVKVHHPYNVDSYGIDGNRNFGLSELTKSAGSEETRYGASTEVVIHPGIIHDVTSVKVKIDLANQKESQVPDLVIDYKIAAEGIIPVEDQKIISGAEIFTSTSPVTRKAT
jgi:hypothetical protein